MHQSQCLSVSFIIFIVHIISLIFPETIKLIGSWLLLITQELYTKICFSSHTWDEYTSSKDSIQKSECYQFSLDWSWWCFRCEVAAAVSLQCLVHTVDKTSTDEGQHQNVNLILVWCLYLRIVLLTCDINFANNHIVILLWGFL